MSAVDCKNKMYDALRDLAYLSVNVNLETVLILCGPHGCGKSFVSEAIHDYFETSSDMNLEESGYQHPSASSGAPCRIFETTYDSHVISNIKSYYELDDLKFLTFWNPKRFYEVDRTNIGCFENPQALAARLHKR